jgi:hypothetical protein
MRPALPLFIGACALAACSRSELRAGPQGGAGIGAPGVGGGPEAPPPPPPPCFLSLAGPALELIAFPEGDADAPQMVVLEPGVASGPSGPQPARIAYQAISEDANFWHPELRIASVLVGADWPESVQILQAPVLAGVDAHAWGKITAAPGSGGAGNPASGIAVAWFHGDLAAGVPTGLKFRPFDTNTWSPGPDVFVDPTGTVAYGFQPGRAVGPSGVDYSGDGYAIAWRGGFEDGSAEPRVAVLDPTGAVVLGPLAAAAPQPYPGRGSDIAWSGATYLVATSFDACGPGDPACAPGSVVVTRVRPIASEPGGVLEGASSIAILSPGTIPRRPVIASRDGLTWLAWSEGPPDDDAAPRAVRLARLNTQGSVVGPVTVVSEDARPVAGLSLAVTSVGVVLMWGEITKPDLPPEIPGHSRLLVHHWSLDGESMGPPLEIPTTGFAYNPTPSAVALAHPRGALVSWAAIEEATTARHVTYLARLDCSETP